MTTCEVVYLSLRRRIGRLCSTLSKKYGVPWDDLHGEACLKYVQVFRDRDKHDPDKAPLDTWLLGRVRYHLLEQIRNRAIKRGQMPKTRLPEDLGKRPSGFVVGEFLETLSRPGRILVRVLLNTPVDVLLDVAAEGDAKPRTVRKMVRRYLRERGWSVERISDAFWEVREALR